VLSYSTNKENPDYAYYVYNERGNLIAKDFDKGSDLIEYQYDNRNNLIKQTHYQSRNIIERKTATYDENNRMLNFETTLNNYNSLYYTLSYEMW
jgi:YD repeat-containing protein